MEREELKWIIDKALNLLFARDAALLGSNNSEWAVAHRIAVYIELELPDWNVDCEFNRQGDATAPKMLAGGSRVRPDIIVHHRGRVEKAHNLLVIELKKVGSSSDHDKVKEYTSPPADNRSFRSFQYGYGLTISLARLASDRRGAVAGAFCPWENQAILAMAAARHVFKT